MRDEKTNTERQLSRREPERAPAYDGRQAEQHVLIPHSRHERSRHGDDKYAQLSSSLVKHERGSYIDDGYHQLTHRSARSVRDVESPRDYRGGYTNSPRHEVSLEEIKDSLAALYSSVKKSSNFLSSFKEDFEQDIVRVKTYAEADDLAYLWVDKVNFSNELGSPAQRQIAQGKARNPQLPRFRDISSQLRASLEVATINSCSSRSEQEIAVGKKLLNAKKEVHDLLSSAPHSVQSVDPLLTELEMLAVLLERNGAGKALSNGTAAGTWRGHKQRQPSADSGYGGSVGGQTSHPPQSDHGDEQGQNESGPEDQSGNEQEQAPASGGGDGTEVEV
ncbi:hypothetical protein P7C71_g4447, partial [Lecanoromycetidae sp. Uapishka_2]